MYEKIDEMPRGNSNFLFGSRSSRVPLGASRQVKEAPAAKLPDGPLADSVLLAEASNLMSRNPYFQVEDLEDHNLVASSRVFLDAELTQAVSVHLGFDKEGQFCVWGFAGPRVAHADKVAFMKSGTDLDALIEKGNNWLLEFKEKEFKPARETKGALINREENEELSRADFEKNWRDFPRRS